LGFLNQTVQTVHRNAQWLVLPAGTSGNTWIAETRPNALSLNCGVAEHLYLWSTIQFEYTDHPDPDRKGERKVKTRYYSHTVTRDDMSSDEVFSWQWHPLADGPTYPHLHVHGGELLGTSLHKLHVPTGRVFLEDVISFLIKDVGVVPATEDWQEVLERNLELVNAHGTWGTRI
jgi:hypothetical protein